MSSFGGSTGGWCESTTFSSISATGNAAMDASLNNTRNLLLSQMKP